MATCTITLGESYELVVPQGADFEEVAEYYDRDTGAAIDITGYTARLMVRETADAAGPPLVSLTTDPGGGLTVDGAAGTVTIEISSATTAALTPGRYRYDLEIVSPAGKVTRLLEGFATVTPEVTRDDI